MGLWLTLKTAVRKTTKLLISFLTWTFYKPPLFFLKTEKARNPERWTHPAPPLCLLASLFTSSQGVRLWARPGPRKRKMGFWSPANCKVSLSFRPCSSNNRLPGTVWLLLNFPFTIKLSILKGKTNQQPKQEQLQKKKESLPPVRGEYGEYLPFILCI